MDNKQLDIAYFTSFCIEQYKNAKGLNGLQAMQILERHGVLNYLEEHFDVLHTQSHQWIVEDIDEFIKLREKEESIK